MSGEAGNTGNTGNEAPQPQAATSPAEAEQSYNFTTLEEANEHIQALEQQVHSLLARNQDLETQNANLEARVQRLEEARDATPATQAASRGATPPAGVVGGDATHGAHRTRGGGAGGLSGGNGGNGGNGNRGNHGNNERGRRGWVPASLIALGTAAVVGAAVLFGGGNGDHNTAHANPVPTKNDKNNPNAKAGFSFTREIKTLGEDNHSIHQDLEAIAANPNAYRVPISHLHGAQAELFMSGQHANTKDLATGSMIASISDPGYRASYANELQGIDAAAPRSDSPEAQQAIVNRALLDSGTTFNTTEWTGQTLNHGAHSSTDVFDESMYLNQIRELQVVPGESTGLQAVNIKDGGGQDGTIFVCLNFLNKEGQLVRTVVSIPQAPVHEMIPHHPRSHPRPHHPHHPRRPHHPRPHQPHTIPPTPHTPTPPPHHTPKSDDHNTPAGVPGENGGTGTNSPTTGPGNGPAGQTPNSSGFLPGENQPVNTSPPVETPAPIDTQPAPTPPSPPETGTDNGPSQPPSNSTNTGTTVSGAPAAPQS